MPICIGSGFRLLILWKRMTTMEICVRWVYMYIFNKPWQKSITESFDSRQHGFGWNSRGRCGGGGAIVWVSECTRRLLRALLPASFGIPAVPDWLSDGGVLAFLQNSLQPSGSTVIRHFFKNSCKSKRCLLKNPDHQLKEPKLSRLRLSKGVLAWSFKRHFFPLEIHTNPTHHPQHHNMCAFIPWGLYSVDNERCVWSVHVCAYLLMSTTTKPTT